MDHQELVKFIQRRNQTPCNIVALQLADGDLSVPSLHAISTHFMELITKLVIAEVPPQVLDCQSFLSHVATLGITIQEIELSMH